MRHLRALLCAAVLLVGALFENSIAQGQQGPSDTPTIEVTSRLVFLDVTPLQLTIRVPRKTRSIRVLIKSADGGRIGAAELDRRAVEAAPAMPGPEPHLLCRQPCQVHPPPAQ